MKILLQYWKTKLNKQPFTVWPTGLDEYHCNTETTVKT